MGGPERSHRRVAGWAAALVLAWCSILAPGLAAQVATVGLDELSRGQKGHGLSVFAGTEPERFEVEVIGILRGRTPELSYIMARLSGQDLERIGVANGMSGSPVYFDGRLAGAVAFSFQFSQDPIAGITPIAGMRRLHAPAVTQARGTGVGRPRLAPVTLDELAAGRFAATRLDEALQALIPESSDTSAAAGVHWQAAGFGAPATAALRRVLGTVSAAGGHTGGAMSADAPLVPGGSVAMALVQGDLNLAAHGTVTEVDGERTLAFGHVVFGFGEIRVPMAHSEVVTTVASTANSFKVANLGPVIGAFDQDREAGVRGIVGLSAPTIPLRVDIRGEVDEQYTMRVAAMPSLVPSLVASSVLGALTSGTYASGPQGLDLAVRFTLAGHDDLLLRQSFDGDSAGIDAAVFVLTYAAYLTGNELEAVDIESIDVTLDQVARPRVATLTGGFPDRGEVAPGETVRLTLAMQPYRGAPERHSIDVSIPEDTPEGRYVLLLGDGSSIDVALRTIVPRVPLTLAEALDVLRGYHSRDQLVVLGLVPAPGLATAGESLPDLPASTRSLFRSAAWNDATPLALKVLDEQTHPMMLPIEGAIRVDLDVRRRPH